MQLTFRQDRARRGQSAGKLFEIGLDALPSTIPLFEGNLKSLKFARGDASVCSQLLSR